MHVTGLKMPEAYDGKCNNGLQNPCECGAPVLPGVFSGLLCAKASHQDTHLCGILFDEPVSSSRGIKSSLLDCCI